MHPLLALAVETIQSVNVSSGDELPHVCGYGGVLPRHIIGILIFVVLSQLFTEVIFRGSGSQRCFAFATTTQLIQSLPHFDPEVWVTVFFFRSQVPKTQGNLFGRSNEGSKADRGMKVTETPTIQAQFIFWYIDH